MEPPQLAGFLASQYTSRSGLTCMTSIFFFSFLHVMAWQRLKPPCSNQRWWYYQKSPFSLYTKSWPSIHIISATSRERKQQRVKAICPIKENLEIPQYLAEEKILMNPWWSPLEMMSFLHSLLVLRLDTKCNFSNTLSIPSNCYFWKGFRLSTNEK